MTGFEYNSKPVIRYLFGRQTYQLLQLKFRVTAKPKTQNAMILSMTGFGRATTVFGNKNIEVEIRSLNSKLGDLRFRMPGNYREKELELRKLLTDVAERGKIDVNINIRSLQGDDDFSLNVALFRRYYTELRTLADELGIEKADILQSIMRIPSVVGSADAMIDQAEWKALLDTMQLALKDFVAFRQEEGNAMAIDLRTRIETIDELLQRVEPFEKDRVEKYRARLEQNLADFLGKENIDRNRFEQEVIFYLEKIDIAEEKVRLEQHLKYFMEQFTGQNSAKGRTLNFIAQEIGREINTMGSKAYSADIQRIVVQMKEELEKIKELVANLV